MSPVFLARGEGRTALALGRLLGEGASGKVYSVSGMPGVAAKLYHGPDEARRYARKIDAMLAHRPDLPPAMHDGQPFAQIAWPEAKLFDAGGSFVGFTMPEVDFGHATSLVNLLQKNSRRIEKIPEYYGYRVLVARNLASVFVELHRAGHHMIDMKPANLRFYPAVSWMAVVDADGFSIAGGAGRIGANQVSDEYIAPESWKAKPDQLGEAQDLFALAAIIFQLLNNGVHPFAGTGAGPTDLQGRIVQGLYPYGLTPRHGTKPSAASVHRMFRPATRAMFDAAFLSARRPSAVDWRDHLDTLIGDLSVCSRRPAEHAHFGIGCAFCDQDARVAAAKARPRPARPAPRALPAPRTRPLPPLPLTHVVPPRRRRRRSRLAVTASAAVWSTVLAGLVGLFVVAANDDWRSMLMPGELRAATVSLALPPSIDELDRLDPPREFIARGDGRIEMREGPGAMFAIAGALAPGDDLVGRSRTGETTGTDWIWVTRLTDGRSGYVHETSLDERLASADAGCAGTATCADRSPTGGERRLDERLRLLQAEGTAETRDALEQISRLWARERARCVDAPDPLGCRARINAQQMRDLALWERTPTAQDGLAPARFE